MSDVTLKGYVRFIRDVFTIPRNRKPCVVCGKYASITEAHHVIPVHQLARLCKSVSVPLDQMCNLPIRYIWLCPNHHVLFHRIGSSRIKNVETIVEDIGLAEYRSLEIIWQMQNWDELQSFLEGQVYG